MKNILNMDREDIKEYLKSISEKPFRGNQIMDFIYNSKIYDFEDMTNLSKDLRNKLKEDLEIYIPKIIEVQRSEEGFTRKYLLEMKDGEKVECVLLKYKYGFSLCISTQIGCRMGCTFCASTVNGLIRNLEPGEMVGEVLAIEKHVGERMSHLILMGMGEPFDNFDNTVKFLNLAIDEIKIGSRKITVSTCGLIPEIERMKEIHPQVNLAISLHAVNNTERDKIMPINKKYNIDDLMYACRKYVNDTSRRITFEYALIEGVNDSESHAKELCSLLRKTICHVNIIPINETSDNNCKKPSKNITQNFLNILTENNISATIRKELGSDIDAACGQLRSRYEN